MRDEAKKKQVYFASNQLFHTFEIADMISKKEENNGQNSFRKGWTKIAYETDISFEMVGHIHYAIIKRSDNKVPFNSKNATQYIIQDLINNDNGAIQDILKNNGIKSSEDFAIVLRKLCEEGLIEAEENDSYEDFNRQFETESIDEFIKLNNLKKELDLYKTISNSFYIIGFVIVVASYTKFVSNEIGWMGWGIGMIGWVLLTFKTKIMARAKKLYAPINSK